MLMYNHALYMCYCLILQEGGDVADSVQVAKHKIANSANFASTCLSMVAQEDSRGHVLSALAEAW